MWFSSVANWHLGKAVRDHTGELIDRDFPVLYPFTQTLHSVRCAVARPRDRTRNARFTIVEISRRGDHGPTTTRTRGQCRFKTLTTDSSL
jgi:hypothetical protein